MKNHVTYLFLDWHENRISASDRSRIEQHLKHCDGCRMYYERMSGVFDDRSLLALKDLQPDPYLPARIRSLRGPRRNLSPIIRWSLAGAVATVALLVGAYIGQGLSGNGQAAQGTNDMSEYHDVIAQHGTIDQWNSAAESVQGEQQ